MFCFSPECCLNVCFSPKTCVAFILSVLVTVVRTTQQAKVVRFLHVAFDTTGDSFLAGDHHGNIYVFDISRNRSDCAK